MFSDFIKNKKQYISLVLNEYRNIIENYSSDFDAKDINIKITSIEKQKDKLLDLSIKGMIDDFEFKKRNDKFNVEIFNLQKLACDYSQKTCEEEKLKKKLETIENCLNTKLDIKENLAYLINLLIERVEIEKVEGNRKHIKLKICYAFNTPDTLIDLDMNEDNSLKSLSSKNLACRGHSSILKCSCVTPVQPWLC